MDDGMFFLREMIGSYRRPAKVLAITSGKGGVGKSNIAANLAICLASSDRKVLLVDADMSLGNLDVILNINSKYNISHVIGGLRSLEEVIHIGIGGVEVICGGSGLEKLADIGEFQRQRLLQEMSKLQYGYDVILIDTGAGISKVVVGFCLAADQVLVVTTPEAAAITDAYAMIKVLIKNNFNGRINVVVNLARTIAEGKKTYQQISNVAGRFLNANIYDAGVLFKDDRLCDSVHQRKPVVVAYPQSKISSSLASLAAQFNSTPFLLSQESRGCEGFFKKVVNWMF